MKFISIKIVYLGVIVMLFVASCTPDDVNMSNQSVKSKDLDFSVEIDSENGNRVILKSNDENAIPFWIYYDGNHQELGHSKKRLDTVAFPFGATYTIEYTAYTQAGPVFADSVEVNIEENDESYFKEEEWELLTNLIDGKTWVLDMTEPIGWGGFDFPYNPDGDDYWNWYPSYQGNEWVMPNEDWGEMTFDLNGGYNVKVIQRKFDSEDKIATEGSFNYDIKNHKITFNGGVELLYGGDYYPDVSNWTAINVIELSESSLRLAVVRDQDRDGEGDAQIVFHYKPKN